MSFPPASWSLCQEVILIIETEILNVSVFGWLTNPRYGGAMLPVFNRLYRIDSKMGQRSSTETVWGNATPIITKAQGTCNIKILLS